MSLKSQLLWFAFLPNAMTCHAQDNIRQPQANEIALYEHAFTRILEADLQQIFLTASERFREWNGENTSRYIDKSKKIYTQEFLRFIRVATSEATGLGYQTAVQDIVNSANSQLKNNHGETTSRWAAPGDYSSFSDLMRIYLYQELDNNIKLGHEKSEAIFLEQNLAFVKRMIRSKEPTPRNGENTSGQKLVFLYSKLSGRILNLMTNRLEMTLESAKDVGLVIVTADLNTTGNQVPWRFETKESDKGVDLVVESLQTVFKTKSISAFKHSLNGVACWLFRIVDAISTPPNRSLPSRRILN